MPTPTLDAAPRDEPVEFVFDGSDRLSLLGSARAIWDYRECVWAFAVRALRVRYKQAVLGVGWAVVRPLLFLAIFILFFGHLVGIKGGQGTPYAAFAISALAPWQFVSTAVTFGGESLIQNSVMLKRVYFPRAAAVVGSVVSNLPDLAIGLVLVLLAVPLTGARLGLSILWLPLLVVLLLLPVLAIAVPLAGLAVYYRDFRYGLPLFVQLWLFASPVAYPITQVPGRWRWAYALANPVAGPLEGFRRVLALGRAPDWTLLGLSAAASTVILWLGFALFKALERELADVV